MDKKKAGWEIWLALGLLMVLAILALISYYESSPPSNQEDLPTSNKIYCTTQDRKLNVCTDIYKPACGWFDPLKVQCIKSPCATTYANGCFACIEENVLYYTEGQCPSVS